MARSAREERANKARREKYNTDPEYREARLNAISKSRFGITRDDVSDLVAWQSGCAICHTFDPGSQGWHVDHDHSCCPGRKSCGKCIRGILCNQCNRALGFFADDIGRLASAIEYLNDYRQPLGT